MILWDVPESSISKAMVKVLNKYPLLPVTLGLLMEEE
jgi:hypothetical protein